MQTALLVLHLMIATALVAVVLLQRSEGGALGIGGGGGGVSYRPRHGQPFDAHNGRVGGSLLHHQHPADAAGPAPAPPSPIFDRAPATSGAPADFTAPTPPGQTPAPATAPPGGPRGGILDKLQQPAVPQNR